MIVIGAGPGGSGFATAMARRGWRTLLLERGELPRHRVCGEFLSPEAVASLAELGIHLEGALPIKAVEVSGPGGERLRFGLRAPAWGIARRALDEQMTVAAVRAGVEVRTGATACRLERVEGDGGWRVHLREGGTLEGRLVVGAWGRGCLPGLRGGGLSRAGLTGAALPAKAAPRFIGVKVHLTGIAPAPAVEIACFDGGYGGLAPIAGGQTNLALLLTPERFRRSAPTPELLLASLPDLAPALAPRLWGASIVPETWRVVAGVDTDRPNQPWDGIPLIGDAATMIPPLAGEGMAMALGAAALLTGPADRFLQGRLDLAGLRRGYVRAWHSAFWLRLAVGRRLQSLLLSPRAAPLIRWGGSLPAVSRLLFGLTRGRLRSES